MPLGKRCAISATRTASAFSCTSVPPPEMLTALPHHERLIPALCEYDLVGFQTGDDAFNFSRYLTRECGLHSHDFNFTVGARTTRVDVFRRHRDRRLRPYRATRRARAVRAAGRKSLAGAR